MENPGNRERKLDSRSKQRENRKHDARANRHRDRGLAQTKPKKDPWDPWNGSTFGFMLHESSGRTNGAVLSESSSASSSEEFVAPEDMPMLLPPKTRDGPVTYRLSIKRVSHEQPLVACIQCAYDQLISSIERTVAYHNQLYETDYRANEVDVKREDDK